MKPAQTILVTGAGRGIGRAIASGLAERTLAKLVLVSRSANAKRVAAELDAKFPGRAQAFEWDVATRGPARDAVIAATTAGPGPIGLVHCAGVLGPTGNFSGNDLDAWWAAMQQNVLGTANVVHALLPAMTGPNPGRIMLFAGGGAAYGYPRFTSYGTAKAALVRFTESLAMELGNDSAVATIVAPGANDTDMLAEVRKAGGEVKTTVDISEPVNLAVRLMTEDTRGLHGRFLHVRDTWSEATARDLGPELFKLRRIEKR